MIQISLKIYLSKYIYANEYKYMYGELEETLVNLVYLNVKTDKTTSRKMIYSKALALAYDREGDGRYKNYEFLIQE